MIKSVMYHYVRPFDLDQPHLFYLNLEDFEQQLEYFEQSIGIITRSQWYSALNDQTELPSGVVLTFDDGLMDHYRYVYPLLKARNLWGIFYISSTTLQAQQLLNVHRVHYLLGRFGGTRVLKVLDSLLSNDLFIPGFYDQLEAAPYSKQTMDNDSLRVKKIVNYALKPESKDLLLSQLFNKLAGDESIVSQQFYMNAEQIAEMADDGFTFGAHGASHNLLTKFKGDTLSNEVTGSVTALNNCLPKRSDTFCYPYGGPDSWNQQVLKELQEQNIRYGFCVESKDITVADIQQRPLLLPRYDCNEFPFGQARSVK